MCCRHSRRQRRTPIVVTLGKAAYDLYQEHQQARQQKQIAEAAVRSVSPQDSVMAREKVLQSNDNLRAVENATQTIPSGAPPSYEDTVGVQPRGVPFIPGDHKQSVHPAAPRDHADDSSDTSSVFETTGMMTPTTEMEAAANQHSKQRQLRPAGSDSHSDLYNRSTPRSEAAEISDIAHWLSQHETSSNARAGSSSSTAAREAYAREQAEAREVEELRRELSRATTKESAHSGSSHSFADRHAERAMKRQTKAADKLVETKLAIKRAYRAEKRELKAAYKQEKEAIKAMKVQSKAELKAWK